MFVEINEFADFHKNFGLRNAAETVAEKICKAMDQTNRTTQETTILNIAPSISQPESLSVQLLNYSQVGDI